jgi:Na+/H+ antiporter NhaC
VPLPGVLKERGFLAWLKESAALLVPRPRFGDPAGTAGSSVAAVAAVSAEAAHAAVVILKIAGESNPAAVVSHVCHQVTPCRVGHAAARAAFFDHLFPYQAQLAQNACVW